MMSTLHHPRRIVIDVILGIVCNGNNLLGEYGLKAVACEFLEEMDCLGYEGW